MTAKEYLSQAFRLDRRIKSDLREIGELRALVSGISSPGFERSYNPNRPTEAPFVKGLERVWSMEERINAEIDRLVAVKEEIRSVIDEVDDYDQRMLLRYRYIHLCSWDEIISQMHYGRSWIYALHGRALLSVDEVLRRKAEK